MAQGDSFRLSGTPNVARAFSFHRAYMRGSIFVSVRIKEKEAGFAMGRCSRRISSPSRQGRSGLTAHFVPYAGSEGYSPVAYLPQVAAALVARALDLDFVPTFYLMRFAGLAALTGLIAYAIAMVPDLAWAFLAISMLPAAISGRSVIDADGSALAAAMVVTALWLRGILSPRLQILGRQSFWMMSCALTRRVSRFVLVGLMPLRGMPARRWHLLALTILPAISSRCFGASAAEPTRRRGGWSKLPVRIWTRSIRL